MVLKRVLLSLSIIGSLVVSQIALADSRNHHGKHGYGQHSYGNKHRNKHRIHRSGKHHYGSHRWGHRKYNRHHGRGFNYSFGNYYPFYSQPWYPRHRHYHSGAFVGGLVVGSLFNYPRYSTRNVETVVYRDTPTTRVREIVYVDQAKTRDTAATVASGRRLLRDLDGNCFERSVDQQGDEIRVQLEAQECNF